MAEYTVEYITKEERKTACDEAHTKGYVMLHDDFTATGGLLTFAEPAPKTGKELTQEQLRHNANDASHRCAEGLANWDSMTSSAQKALVKDILVVIKLLATREGLL